MIAVSGSLPLVRSRSISLPGVRSSEDRVSTGSGDAGKSTSDASTRYLRDRTNSVAPLASPAAVLSMAAKLGSTAPYSRQGLDLGPGGSFAERSCWRRCLHSKTGFFDGATTSEDIRKPGSGTSEPLRFVLCSQAASSMHCGTPLSR